MAGRHAPPQTGRGGLAAKNEEAWDSGETPEPHYAGVGVIVKPCAVSS